jgi:hypothetical protein
MAKKKEESDTTFDFQQTVKGIIAVFITIMIVVIIVMLFAKSLFVANTSSTTSVKTGHLTETEYVSVATTTNEEVAAITTKKKSTTAEEEESEPDVSLPDGLDTSVAGKYVVSSAVYLHPQSNSSSENLMTLPSGAEVEVYGVENYGWYYLEYDGQFGYAYMSYLTKQ